MCIRDSFDGVGLGKRVRHREAKELSKKLKSVMTHFKDQSLILIGDTNCKNSDEQAIDVFENSGLVDLNDADASTYPGYGGSPFDRAFVAKGRPEFRYTRQYVMQSADMRLHDKFLSDHYLIKISVKLIVDESDPRQKL